MEKAKYSFHLLFAGGYIPDEFKAAITKTTILNLNKASLDQKQVLTLIICGFSSPQIVKTVNRKSAASD